jgi:pimeloyl-ACP methyl ester carboxylesterase
MGGLIVMELAAAQPDRWWALGFIATTAEPVTEAERAGRRAKARTAEDQGMGPIAADMAGALFGPGASEALTGEIMAMMLATNPLGAAAAMRGRGERPDYRASLRALTTPSFVCTGDRDTFSTAEVTRNPAGCLREPEVVLFGGAGHLPNLERPAEFNEHLLAFLKRARA